MAVILGLLIFCMGIYFLSLFFQVAPLEKDLADGVTLLERYMIVTYALDKPKDGGEVKPEDGDAGPEAGASGVAKGPAKPA